MDAHRSIGHAPGAFVTKTIKGRAYCYFQYSTPGGGTLHAYVGPRSDALDAVVERFATEREDLREDRERIDELAAVLRMTLPRSRRAPDALLAGGRHRLRDPSGRGRRPFTRLERVRPRRGSCKPDRRQPAR